MINLFGGSGFVGTTFKEKFECIANDRNNLFPGLADGVTDILYLISTVDNYNVTVNPYVDIETNLTTLIRVLENFRLTGRRNVVFNFASSWFVYGDTDLPAREDSYCDPKGFYSITKRAAEQLLISYCETYKIQYRIFRFANVLGPNDKKASKKKNALTYLINQIKEDKEIYLYDNGEFYRDYIHVSDLCYAMKLVMAKGKVNEIYNIGNGEKILFRDLIKYAVEKAKSRSTIYPIQQPDFHKLVQVKSMYMDNSKIRSLGYSPVFTIKTIIDQLLQ